MNVTDQRISHELRVRYNECDAQGIVFNANWLMYSDVVMTEFWRQTIGGYQHLSESLNVETVVAETGSRYRGIARFDDVLTFVARVTRLGRSSMRVEIESQKGDELLYQGFLEYVFVDAHTLTPVPIPDRIREILQVPADS